MEDQSETRQSTLRSEDFKKRRVAISLSVDLVYHPEVFNGATGPTGERNHYGLATDEEVIEHLLFNLLQGRRLSSLDGWADLPAAAAFVENINWLDLDSADEPEPIPSWLHGTINFDVKRWLEEGGSIGD